MQPLTYKPGDIHADDVDYITVDGKRVESVFMACPRRGVVDAYQRDSRGMLKEDKTGTRLLTKRYRGAVRVVFRDGTVDAGGGRDCP